MTRLVIEFIARILLGFAIFAALLFGCGIVASVLMGV